MAINQETRINKANSFETWRQKDNEISIHVGDTALLEFVEAEWAPDGIENLSKEDSIKLISDGELGKMKAIIKDEDILLYAIEEGGEVKAKYAISYVNMFASVSKVNKKVNIHIDEKLPLKIQYDLDDVMDEDDDDEEDEATNYLRFYLAPKIEDF